jgi:hypothetical protein
MDMNDYMLERMVRERISGLHADAERRHRLEAASSVSRRRRDTLGRALIRIRARLFGASSGADSLRSTLSDDIARPCHSSSQAMHTRAHP